MYSYARYDAKLGIYTEISEKEYNNKIRKKYMFPVWDEYHQKFTDTYYDSRDGICRIFYFKKEVNDEIS